MFKRCEGGLNLKPQKTYDCFCYFNEDMLLELRLKTLWDVVDVFVIVEASYQHSGLEKPLNFSKERFIKYMSKIRYFVATDCPGGRGDPWANERAQRDEIIKGLHDAHPEDRIVISDLDEIPYPDAFERYDPRKKRGDFRQQYFSYYFNNRLVEPKGEQVWHGSKITLFRYFVDFFDGSATAVRSYKSKGPLRSLKRTWFRLRHTQRIDQGGWHFTWIMSVDGIVEKMNATAHQENNRPAWRTEEYISNTIAAGRDLVRESRRYSIMEIDDSFPRELQTNRRAYTGFILSRPIEDGKSSYRPSI